MHFILFAAGAFMALAGCVMMRYGLPLDEYGQSALLTPGMVAFVGGLILVALGAIARTLNRIAARYELQPLPLPPVADLGVGASMAPRRQEPVREADATAPPVAPKAPAVPKAPPVRTVGQRQPLLAWLNRSKQPGAVAPAPAAPMAAGLPLAAPGAPPPAPPPAAPPHIDLGPLAQVPERPAAPTVRPPKPSEFVTRSVTIGDRAASRAPSGSPSRAAPPSAGGPSSATTVYKSGVIDGMAYTLFMDGSIEAELPHGKVRFATIDQLQAYLAG